MKNAIPSKLVINIFCIPWHVPVSCWSGSVSCCDTTNPQVGKKIKKFNLSILETEENVNRTSGIIEMAWYLLLVHLEAEYFSGKIICTVRYFWFWWIIRTRNLADSTQCYHRITCDKVKGIDTFFPVASHCWNLINYLLYLASLLSAIGYLQKTIYFTTQ